MKAVLLAGGKGTRLLPFTKFVNKHLLPINNKPIIQYSVETLRDAGITDIAVVLGDFNCGDIVEFLGDGSSFGVNLTYYYQGEAKGVAHAVNCAKNFIDNEDNNQGFLVYLGDNIFSNGIKPFVDAMQKGNPPCGLLFANTTTPERFGVPVFNGSKLLYIWEKPRGNTCLARSTVALTGCYYFPPTYFELFKQIKPSGRGEYELTDIINNIINLDNDDTKIDPIVLDFWKSMGWEYKTNYQFYDGWWMDAGTFEGIREIESRLRNEPNNS